MLFIDRDIEPLVRRYLTTYPALCLDQGTRHARVVHSGTHDFVPLPESSSDRRARKHVDAALRRLALTGRGFIAHKTRRPSIAAVQGGVAMSEDHFLIALNNAQKFNFLRLSARVAQWAADHQSALGLLEIAAGAGLVLGGLKLGAITLGVDVVLSTGGKLGSLAGGPAAIGLYALGSIGVVAAGGAIGIPAALVALAGGGLSSLAGYAIGDLVSKVADPVTIADLAASGSLLVVGVALMLDGAKRLAADLVKSDRLSAIRDHVLHLARVMCEGAIGSLEELARWVDALARDPQLALLTAGSVAAAGVAASAAAAGSVTVLGSTTLGGIGVSLGLLSAPLWPVIAAIAATTVVSYAVWRATTGRVPT